MKVRFPNGDEREFDNGVLLIDVAKSISEGLARNVLGAVVNGEIKGLQEPVYEDSDVKFVKFEDEEGKEIFWHTSSHLMAAAIQRLYPDTLFAIGPAIENGFYYDIDSKHQFVPEDLEQIEKKMQEIVKEGHLMIREEISRQDALALFEERKDIYKVELISEMPEDEIITIYRLGDFVDLCRGPHLYDIKKIKAFKLMSIAGAYWRGNSDNQMLQRIYGISFEKDKELKQYVNMIEEAKKRDHRKLGKELELFLLKEEGPGFPFYLPNGMIIKNALEDYWRGLHAREGYGEITTPLILNRQLWLTSGHWDHYKENMYFTQIDEEDYAIKPMNCPGSMLVYKSKPHSYRELPIRLCELGFVHRHELSGALHGLFRVRAFTQDDAHIFMLPSQIKDEIIGVMKLADEIYSAFGFKYKVAISTQPEDSMGEKEDWDKAILALKEAVETLGIEYKINEGDGAFYGPKIDIQLLDSMGRPWQCGTIQLDFQMPERFDLTYVDENGEKKRPVMLHRAIYGSLERFLGILIEHYAGNFPMWLAPVQATLIPVSMEHHYEGVKAIEEQLKSKGFRVDLDARDEKMGKKIRESQMSKIPYQLVFGDKELEENTVTVRRYGEKQTETMPLEDFIKMATEEVELKK
ncbi:MAG: threonine--tRNA ligase [Tissierellia bacterium]|nr:threonine--tRNA ligase [Tissierellia bacterium]